MMWRVSDKKNIISCITRRMPAGYNFQMYLQQNTTTIMVAYEYTNMVNL